MAVWNEFTRIKKSRKDHRCAGTGKMIPKGSSCWHFIGEYEGDFQSWYLCEEAMKFFNDHPELFNDPDGYECSQIGEEMREFERKGEPT